MDIVAMVGRVFIVQGPSCWGKSDKLKTANANAKKNWPNFLGGKSEAVIIDAPADAYLDDMGRVCWKQGKDVTPPRAIGKLTWSRR